MATETFPALTAVPGYPLEERYSGISSLTSKAEAGYVHGRKRYTTMRKIWSVYYPYMSSTDKNTLDAFVVTVGGTAIDFDWTNDDPNCADSPPDYEVRFLDIPVFKLVDVDWWEVSFELLEI